mmetsp:Transcript_25699/g.45044  ORF Transcript_25699/g.45044 Transcript_25699/m.45044 type:complete len:83 (-) Transcript_25699:2933-3181(-)
MPLWKVLSAEAFKLSNKPLTYLLQNSGSKLNFLMLEPDHRLICQGTTELIEVKKLTVEMLLRFDFAFLNSLLDSLSTYREYV